MLFGYYEETFEDIGSKKLEYEESLHNQLQNSIFKLFGRVFKSEYKKGYRMGTQLLIEVMVNILLAFQMIALSWYPDMNISGWKRYKSFWQFISFFNITKAFSIIGIMKIYFYSFASILLFCAGALIVMLGLEITKFKMPKLLFRLLRKLLLVWATVLYVPSLVEFSMVFKYSFFNYDKTYEMPGDTNPQLFDYGNFGAITSLFLIIFLVLIAYFWELFTTDTRHSHWGKILTVRAHSSVDLKFLVFKTLVSINYVSFGDENAIKFRFLFMIASFWIFIEFLRKVPYYNKFENAIKSCGALTVSLSFFAVLFGDAMDNAGVIFLLVFFMQPISIFITCWYTIIKTKNNKDSDFSPVNTTNQYKFERSIRHLLCNKNLEDKTKVINYFSDCYTNKTLVKDKLLVIWEVNFCSFSMKNQKLARIKLTKKKSIISTLEGKIQELRTLKIIDKRDSSSIDSLYVEYLEDINKAKAQDFEICCILLDLWSELTAKIPQYNKIHHFAIKSCGYLLNLKEFYAQLISKHKHMKLYDLYATFLQDILGECDQASNINRLKGAVSRQMSASTLYEANIFSDEDEGIILISANENAFGIIAYINDKASQLLKGTISDLIGTDLHDYIPSIYALDHKDYMKNFYIEYIEEEISHQGLFFIQNILGNLVECKFRIKLLAFHNNAYFLVTLSSINVNRQLALISEEGVILNCTELFPHYVGATASSIRNSCITDFIPHLNISEMKPYEPLIIQQHEKQIAIIHAIKVLRTTDVHMLLIVHNEKEISLWKNGQDISQIEYFKKNILVCNEEAKARQYISSNYLDVGLKSMDITPVMSPNHGKQEETYRLFGEDVKKRLNHFEYTEEKTSNIQGSSVSNSATTIVNKNIEILSRKLKVFEKILLLCILAVISINIAVLVYIYQVTAHSNSLNVFTHFGNIMFHLVNSADLARSIDSEKRSYVYNLTRDLGYFKETINELKNLREFILSDYNDWSYCSSSSIVTDNVIPVWMFDPSPHIENFNFYDEVGIFIKHGDSLIDTVVNNEPWSNTNPDVKFFGLNSFGYTFEFTHRAMAGLVDCEVNRVGETDRKIAALVFVGIGLLTIFIGILVWYSILMTKSNDYFWNIVKRSSQMSYSFLREACLERLSRVHGIDYSKNSGAEHYKNKTFYRAIRSRLYVKYIWRLSIFLAIALCYYFILKFYLYNHCENHLWNRPKLLFNLITKRTLLSRMSVFARDINTSSNLRLFPKSYAVESSKNEFNSSNEEFRAINSDLRKKDFLNLMSDDMKKRFFEERNTNDHYFKQGLYAASNILYIDAKFISVTVSGNASVPVYSSYIGNETALQNAMGEDYEIIDKDSKEIIDQELNLLIYVTVIFSSALVLLYMLFYLPFIYYEKRSLVKLKLLMSIIKNCGELNSEKL
ncbi:unnamed protein product [Blepharisma stoltei]|uniref:PAS domain-containing protein n=1 Tax=Blepharisma stoltei TaxID=1481888 RepID=A0AAU9JEH6_9CILI|nr:unnamed protein product [Blepharisma stoltei]